MITWHPHTKIPTETTVAIIATASALDGKRFLLPHLYRYSERDGCWIGESSGLPLKHAEFDWLNETDLLQTMKKVGSGGTAEVAHG